MEEEKKVVDNSTLSDVMGVPDPNNPIASAVNPLSFYPNSPAFLITLQPYLLNNAYKTYGVLQTIIDQPVMDAFGVDIDFDSTTLSSDELDLLKKTMEDEGDFEAACNVCRWQRLTGGGVLIANTQQKSDKEMNERGLYNKKLKFIASDRWETIADSNMGAKSDKFLYYDTTIDKSRVYTLIGKQAPYYIRLRLQGWGLSVYEQTLSDIIKFFKAQNVCLELLDEAKIDVLKIFNLANSLGTKASEDAVKRRINIAATQKNYKSVLAMDSEDDYQQKQINFSGLAPLQAEIRLMMCASARIPEQKLYGVGTGGFSDDDGILETYNKMVKSDVQYPAKRMLMWQAQLRCWQLFGREIPDLELKFGNLREMSKMEETDLDVKKGNFVLELFKNRLLNPQETMQALEKENVFTMQTQALQGKINDEFEGRYEELLKNDIKANR